MSITDAGKVCLFSGISGTITLNGKPVKNARLIRTAKKEKPKSDETTTDENGHFSMPPIYERTVTKYLPMEFVVSQTIVVEYEGQQYEMWHGVKRKEEENAESKGKPLVVTCKLELEKQLYKSVDGSPVFSLCTWDAEADKPYDGPFFDEE